MQKIKEDGKWISGVIRDSKFGCPSGCSRLLKRHTLGAKKEERLETGAEFRHHQAMETYNKVPWALA